MWTPPPETENAKNSENVFWSFLLTWHDNVTGGGLATELTRFFSTLVKINYKYYSTKEFRKRFLNFLQFFAAEGGVYMGDPPSLSNLIHSLRLFATWPKHGKLLWLWWWSTCGEKKKKAFMTRHTRKPL